VIEKIGHSKVVQRGGKHQLRLVQGERAGNADGEGTSIALELPSIERSRSGHPIVDAAVPCQVGGLVDGTSLREIGGRGDHSHAQVRTDFPRDHVALDFLAEPDASIKAVGDDVAVGIIDQHFDHCVGMRFDEGGKHRPDDRVIGLPCRGKPQRAGDVVTPALKDVQRAMDCFQRWRDRRKQGLAGLRCRDASARALKQTRSQLGFEPANRMAQIGCGHIKAGSGAGEVSFPGDYCERCQIIKAGLHHHSISFNEACDESNLFKRFRIPTLSSQEITEITMIAKDAVWLITGCSKGLGLALVEQVLAAGYRVVATARREVDLAGLAANNPDNVLTLMLDVTNNDQIKAVVAEAEKRFGQVDVLVNNAGYGYLGAIEEGDDAEVRALFDTNLFAPVALIKAVLPGMRERRHGYIVNISSIGGLVTYAGVGYYNMVKAGVEALSDVLAKEVGPLGIGVTVVAPGAFRTNFRGPGSLKLSMTEIADYADTVGKSRAGTQAGHGKQTGDPARGALAIVTAVEAAKPLPCTC
jgi:NAD(P)-dependent dehydrogenase (short-subunit alcohol dehydrogenase family)